MRPARTRGAGRPARRAVSGVLRRTVCAAPALSAPALASPPEVITAVEAAASTSTTVIADDDALRRRGCRGSPGCAARARARRSAPRRRAARRRCRTGLCSSPRRGPARAGRRACARRASLADAPRICCPAGWSRRCAHRRKRSTDLPDYPLRGALPRSRRPAPGAPRRGRRRAGDLHARRADVVVSVAQGDPAGARRRLSLHRARPRRLRRARTSRPTSAGTPTTATPSWRRRCSRTSTCAARRSSCTTGAGRSGCAWPSSTPSGSSGS